MLVCVKLVSTEEVRKMGKYRRGHVLASIL